MIERLAFGEIPRKHHIALTGEGGALRWEECITQQGFEGPYTICYHLERPHEQRVIDVSHGWPQP
jgi:homogentisate 1,2-dioxygenase